MLEKFLPGFWNSVNRPISENAKPAIVLKPHHFSNNAVWGILNGETPRLLAGKARSYRVSKKKSSAEDNGYWSDVLGETDPFQERYRDNMEQFLNQIIQLPNHAVVHLDLQPDGICKNCAAGKHCMGTNYKTENPPMDTLRGETAALNLILSKLEKYEFRPGIDFIAKPTAHTLYDFEGRALNSPEEPTPISAEFNSLLVRIGALRYIRAKYGEMGWAYQVELTFALLSNTN